jgi:hypothetical protein
MSYIQSNTADFGDEFDGDITINVGSTTTLTASNLAKCYRTMIINGTLATSGTTITGKTLTGSGTIHANGGGGGSPTQIGEGLSPNNPGGNGGRGGIYNQGGTGSSIPSGKKYVGGWVSGTAGTSGSGPDYPARSGGTNGSGHSLQTHRSTLISLLNSYTLTLTGATIDSKGGIGGGGGGGDGDTDGYYGGGGGGGGGGILIVSVKNCSGFSGTFSAAGGAGMDGHPGWNDGEHDYPATGGGSGGSGGTIRVYTESVPVSCTYNVSGGYGGMGQDAYGLFTASTGGTNGATGRAYLINTKTKIAIQVV